MLERLATIQEQELQKAETAFHTRSVAFLLDANHAIDQLSELERLAEQEGLWAQLAKTLQKKLEQELPLVDKSDLLTRLSEYALHKIQHPELAIWALTELATCSNEPEKVLEELLVLQQEQELWAEAIETIKQLLESIVDPQKQTKLQLAQAMLQLQKLHNEEEALALFSKIFASSTDTTHAVEALERAAISSDWQAERYRLLEELFSANEEHERLATLIEHHLSEPCHETPPEKLMQRLATLLEDQLEKPEQAFQWNKALFQLDPTHPAYIAAIERYAEATGSWSSLITLAEPVLRDKGIKDKTKLKLGRRALNWSLERSKLPEEAAAIVALISELSEASDLYEYHRQIALFFAEKGNEEQALVNFKKAADLALHEMKDTALSLTALEQANSLFSKHEDILQAMQKLYLEEQNWEHAAHTMQELYELSSGANKLSFGVELSTLLFDKLEQHEQALSILLECRSADPSNQELWELIRKQANQTESYSTFAEHVVFEASQVAETKRKGALYLEAGHLYQDQLTQPSLALSQFEQAASFLTEDKEVLLLLAKAYEANGDAEKRIKILEQLVTSYGRTRNKEAAVIHQQLASAYLSVNDNERALEHFDLAFKMDLSNIDVLREYGMLCYKLEQWDLAQKKFRALLLQRLDEKSGITKADVYFYLGDIASKQGDSLQAKNMLKRALAESPGHERAKEKLTEFT
ncbi:MAG: hypothetical protein IPJ88_12865 [Myxococcales bacterium]|nr:MAG: hypothetical protein IPJ88_12865 [Myxococcales bacterium]